VAADAHVAMQAVRFPMASGRMLIAKCYALALHLKDGRTVRPGGVLLHDPSGKCWPRTSCLITTFRKTGRPLESPTDEEIAWARDPKSVREGFAFVPAARSMSSWSRVGEVVEIDYKRVGEYQDLYVHEFKRPVSLYVSSFTYPQSITKVDKAWELYKKQRTYRIELGPKAEFNWRGFVSP
jgi:hypothetical protein